MATMFVRIVGGLFSPSQFQRRYNTVCTVETHLYFFLRSKVLPNLDVTDKQRFSSSDNALWLMKRLFSKSPKSQPSASTSAAPAQNNVVKPPPPPKAFVPPTSHPRPYDHIAVLPTQDGLLLRPHVAHQGESDHYVRIAWGKVPEIKEFQGSVPTPGVNWTLAVIVYGIVGILDLFAGSLSSPPIETFLNFYVESYLLVITSRLDVGHGEHFRSLHLDAKVSFAD